EELDPPRQPEHLPLAPIRCIDLVSQREREVENDDFVEAQHPSNSPVAPNAQVKPHRAAGWARWQALPAAWASLRNDVGLNALLGPIRTSWTIEIVKD